MSSGALTPIANWECVVEDLNGAPWFIAKDVRDVLGLSNPSVSCRPLSSDEVSNVSRSYIGGPGGGRAALLISESGLYKLVMRSDKPVAKPFQNWVTRDVLPAIRKHGMYVLGEEKVATGAISVEEVARSRSAMRAKVRPMDFPLAT